MVKSKQLHQTQQEQVQKACAKPWEDQRVGNTPNFKKLIFSNSRKLWTYLLMVLETILNMFP
ncbi:hypothetical protein BDR04DRAFT_1092314 [Suillus decipiens]|nr:hypothetical protein BDR04DRAFT_1092314 [Suillus decipiens]